MALGFYIHSSKLTWKWRGASYKTTILDIGPLISFHVNLGEGRDYMTGSTRAFYRIHVQILPEILVLARVDVKAPRPPDKEDSRHDGL